ncbi:MULTISPECIES: RNA polymerase sigma factor [Aureibaculum]|uniref:RNA polymerase sigma factor n=1 Tax=unclassified Aureibaculum TaxID=2795985 RepID=UPI002AAD0609|nr:sigma-70 family RNA polymerase sigma factor [Aureibaculum sp. 2210JD6-5]MDY7395617.1 sigma-70 family RNA polymerase sigma factor [Aureibaculum sp. 2210JD6-5]
MQKQKLDDSVLVRNYINGSERSLEILVGRHKQKIYSFIYSKVLDRDIAEDIFQDAFIKVIRTLKLGNYNEEGKFLPWVMRISHNLVIDHFRKSNRMPSFKNTEEFDIFSVLSDSSLNAEKEIIKNQIHFDVRRIIEELPEDQKEVLIMRIYRDMSFKEISENTGVSINTALGRMRYALINLRKIIEKNKIVLTN